MAHSLELKFGEKTIVAPLQAVQPHFHKPQATEGKLTIGCQDKNDDPRLHKGTAAQPQLNLDSLELEQGPDSRCARLMRCRKLQQCKLDACCWLFNSAAGDCSTAVCAQAVKCQSCRQMGLVHPLLRPNVKDASCPAHLAPRSPLMTAMPKSTTAATIRICRQPSMLSHSMCIAQRLVSCLMICLHSCRGGTAQHVPQVLASCHMQDPVVLRKGAHLDKQVIKLFHNQLPEGCACKCKQERITSGVRNCSLPLYEPAQRHHAGLRCDSMLIRLSCCSLVLCTSTNSILKGQPSSAASSFRPKRF